jgi:hypothetical protein
MSPKKSLPRPTAALPSSPANYSPTAANVGNPTFQTGTIAANGMPVPISFSNQRINTHDRIEYNAQNPFKIKKDKHTKN